MTQQGISLPGTGGGGERETAIVYKIILPQEGIRCSFTGRGGAKRFIVAKVRGQQRGAASNPILKRKGCGIKPNFKKREEKTKGGGKLLLKDISGEEMRQKQRAGTRQQVAGRRD